MNSYHSDVPIACDRRWIRNCCLPVDLPLTRHPSPSLIIFAFRSSEVRRLLLDLDPFGGIDPYGMFPHFLKRINCWCSGTLSVLFWQLVRLGSFIACWSQANVSLIPKGPPYSSVAKYRTISITSRIRLLNVWCRFVLEDLWNSVVCLKPPSLLIGKVRVPVIHFCACPIHCKVHWRISRRLGSCKLISALLSIGWTLMEFSILCSVCIGGTVLSILTQLLSNRSQHVVLDGCLSIMVNVASRVPLCSVLGPLLSSLYTS